VCSSQAGVTTFARLAASEHVHNVTNIGLNIHLDMLSEIATKK